MSIFRWTTPALCMLLGGLGTAEAQQRSWTQSAAQPQPPAWSQGPAAASAAQPAPVADRGPTYVPAAVGGATSANFYPLPGRAAPAAAPLQADPIATTPPAASGIVPTAAHAAPQARRPVAYTAQMDSMLAAPSSGYPTGPMMNGPASYGPPPSAATMPYGGPAGGPWPQPDPVSSGFTPNFDASFASPGYAPPLNDCCGCDPGGCGCGPWFFAGSGLIMTRSVPNNVELASLASDPQISVLNTERTGIDWTAGFETRLGRAIGQRWAIEAVYWMLAPTDDATLITSDTNELNSRLDFQNLSYQGSPLSEEYNNSHQQRLTRHNSFQNIELNVLQQALAVDPANRFGMMYFAGARYFRFNERLTYEGAAADALLSANDPATQTDYWVREDNNLVGGQFGGRASLNIGNRLRLFAMPRFGIFNNRIIQQQHVCMIIDDHSVKNSVALLGQMDAGIAFQIFPCCSIFGSYRAMGLSGIATSDDNIARSFLSPPALSSVNSSSSLILHGAQAGIQIQF